LAYQAGLTHNIIPTNRRGAARRFEQGAEHLDRGCFARAVGAEQTEDFTLFDREADVIDRRSALPPFGQPAVIWTRSRRLLWAFSFDRFW